MRNQLAVICIAGVLIVPATLFAQTSPAAAASPAVRPAPTSLSFDVASVRPAAPIDQATIFAGLREGRRPQWMRIEGSRATYTYMSLKELIASGYKVRTYQVSGPDWLTTDRFDIKAKLPDGAPKDDVPAMLQSLLVDRFKLAAHLETKEHPVLGLMSAKSGIKLQAVAAPPPIDETAPLKPGETKVDSTDGPLHVIKNPDGSTTYLMGSRGTMTLKVDGDTGTMHLTSNGMTMAGFASMLTTLGGGNGRQVVDQTALTGNYDLGVDFSLSDLVSSLHEQGIEIPVGPGGGGGGSAASDPNGDTTVSEALAKIGLKLEKSKAMVEQLVVDHVEKAATEN